jgi:hypothetical protein
MVRIKAVDLLRKVDFDKCLNVNTVDGNAQLSNPFSINNKKRLGLRGSCDNKKNTSIFRDLSKTLDEIELERLNEEGPILTSKLEGTLTSGISRKNNPEMERELDQVGGGRKRKYVHHDKKCAKIAKLCGEMSASGSGSGSGRRKKRKATKKRGRKRSKKTKHHRSTAARKRRKTKKHQSGKKKKRHFKKHNIFTSSS